VGGHFGGDVESGDELGWFCGEWRGAESRGVCVLEMSMCVVVERFNVCLFERNDSMTYFGLNLM
jgi:hypothetical protein